MTLARTLVLCVALATALFAGCSDDDSNNSSGLTCGEGTQAADGTCVPVGDGVTCGEGTTLSGTECLPDDPGTPVECAPGTTLTNNRCEPDVLCGPGTTANLQGECVPDSLVACGDDTVLMNGECVVDPATVVSCAGSTVLVGAECLSRNEALALEMPTVSVEPDHPEFGGTETPITLPAIGEYVVASGVIDAPVDLDTNGQLDQDHDYFIFTGSAGDVIEIELANDGLAEPHVSIVYKDTDTLVWSKTLPENVTIDPIRYFVLPRDGEYQVVVTHAAFYRQLVPRPALGSPDYKYYLVIEHAPDLTPTAATLPASLTGTFSDHIGSAISIASSGGANFALASGVVDSDAYEAEINVYDADGLFSATTIGDAGLGIAIKDGVTLVPEYRQTAVGDENFTIDIEVLPNEALPSSKTGEELVGGNINFYAVEPPDNSLLEVTVTLDNGAASDLEPVIALVNYDLQNVTQVFTFSDDSLTFRYFVETSAPYMLVVADAQPGGGSDHGYSIDFSARPVNVIGALYPANASASGTTGVLDGTAGTTALVAFKNDSTSSGRIDVNMAPQTATEAVSSARWLVDGNGVTTGLDTISVGAGVTLSDSQTVDGAGFSLYEVSLTTAGTSDVDVDGTYVQALQVSSTPAATISNAAILNDVIAVPTACTVADISVDMDITHSYIGDIIMDLTAPDGVTTVRLWNRTGGGQTSISGTFPTSLMPAESLAGFTATNGMGDWTLTIEDTFGGDDGTLNSWGLTIFCQ